MYGNVNDFLWNFCLDQVYIENNRPNQPYFICSIQDFSVVSQLKLEWVTSSQSFHDILLITFLSNTTLHVWSYIMSNSTLCWISTFCRIQHLVEIFVEWIFFEIWSNEKGTYQNIFVSFSSHDFYLHNHIWACGALSSRNECRIE